MLEPVTAMNYEMSVKKSDYLTQYIIISVNISKYCQETFHLYPRPRSVDILWGARLFLGDVCTRYYDPDTVVVFQIISNVLHTFP